MDIEPCANEISYFRLVNLREFKVELLTNSRDSHLSYVQKFFAQLMKT